MTKFTYLSLAMLSLVITLPAASETIYLVIKSAGYDSSGVSIHSIPMDSLDQCEEAGATIIGSSRFDIKYVTKDGFECIVGK